MEYFIGSLITIATVVIVNKLISKRIQKLSKIKIGFSQTRTFEITKHMIPIEDLMPSFKPLPDTQTSRHFNSISTRIIFVDDQAWWIKNNTLFSAEVVEGQFSEESGKKVDTMGMDKVQLDKTIFIVEKLTEGLNNDRGNSR
jgi:hypothetical protein